MAYAELQIANKLLALASANDCDELMSNLKLQKLLYYEQGCISPQYEVMRQLFGNGMFHEGDSIYVLPEMPGNYMAEQDGKITTVFGGDNPHQFVNNYGFIGDFLYNTSR